MIVHQAPGEAGNLSLCTGLREQFKVEGAIRIREEHGEPTVAALGDMMRNAGEDDTGEYGNMACMVQGRCFV